MKKRDTNLPTQRKALKITETADTLGVNPASIRRAIQRGMLRPCRAFRHVLISVEEIERFLRENS
jgi:DNA-directed RNA polymerase specialized sigma24 family protein